MSARLAVMKTHLQGGLKQQVKDCTEAHKHKGFGKVILFGEHFVVYELPSVVCAVKEYTDCMVERAPGTDGWTVVDNRPAVPGYITSKAAEQALAHDLVIKHLGLDLSNGKGIKITLGGPLVPTSGIGASASNVCALARALSECFDLNLNEEQVNQAAYVGEGGYHGTPSGIDNTAATFGGLLQFRRSKNGPVFNPLKTKSSAYLVVVSTGITASTTKVVGDVRRMKEEKPAWFDSLSKEYTRIATGGIAAAEAGDWKRVGALMNENHEILKNELLLTIPELEAIVTTARSAGALGAKLSGTGRGGIAIALCDTKELQRNVAAAVRRLPSAKFVFEYQI
eukprot:TRINITY_DN776_c0_g1_i1.p2 TRINITY_DN776_c0_g1~~TRINITY_DN776_c0_g1_i1.p2  ORF type:complete len:339 (+),score=182.68 TRINITY_DN776_c0_g1_i1:66-1082(+)